MLNIKHIYNQRLLQTFVFRNVVQGLFFTLFFYLPSIDSGTNVAQIFVRSFKRFLSDEGHGVLLRRRK